MTRQVAATRRQVGAPDRPVPCPSGDGAFHDHLSEAETARRRRIPLVTVIDNNSALDEAPAIRALVLAEVVTDALPRALEPWNPPA